jgi:hypothetical protein
MIKYMKTETLTNSDESRNSGKVNLRVLFVLIIATFVSCKESPELPEVPSYVTLSQKNKESSKEDMFYYKKPEDAISDFKKAVALIKEDKVNQARFLLGRLELSNVNFEFKERVLLLREAIPVVDWDDFKDKVSYEDYLKESYIYRDAQVEWAGEAEKTQAGNWILRLKTSNNIIKKDKKSKGKKDTEESEDAAHTDYNETGKSTVILHFKEGKPGNTKSGNVTIQGLLGGNNGEILTVYNIF